MAVQDERPGEALVWVPAPSPGWQHPEACTCDLCGRWVPVWARDRQVLERLWDRCLEVHDWQGCLYVIQLMFAVDMRRACDMHDYLQALVTLARSTR